MTRPEAIRRAAELQVTLIKESGVEGNTNLKTWQGHFSTYPMRSKKYPMFSLLGFIEGAERGVYAGRREQWTVPIYG